MRNYECYVCKRSGKNDSWEDKSLYLASCQDCGFYYCASTNYVDTKTGCFYSQCHDLCSGDLTVLPYHLTDENCPHWPDTIPKDQRRAFAECLDKIIKAVINKKFD